MIASLRQQFGDLHLLHHLMVVIVLLNFVDYLTTITLINATDYSVEANPLLRSLMEYFDSTLPIVIVKTGLIGLAWGMIYHFRDHPKCNLNRIVPVAAVLATAFAAVCVWNFSLIYMYLLS